MIAGNETGEGVGLQAFLTGLRLPDFTVRVAGVAVGINDRVEVSLARQSIDTDRFGVNLGLGRDYKFEQDIIGLKVKIAGDLVYGMSHVPAIAVGVQFKNSRNDRIVKAVGARHGSGVDYYASASKLLLGRSVMIGVTARLTKANQFGLLGFGGDKASRYRLQPEATIAYQLNRSLVIGAEYRAKPNNLRFAKENNAFDLFATKAIGRNTTATLAYVGLGSIATMARQRGFALQLQAAI